MIAKVLTEEFGAVPLGRKHNTVGEILEKGIMNQQQIDNCLVLANIRNPYDRLTTYFQRYKGQWAFSESLRVQEGKLQRDINSGQLTAHEQAERLKQFERSCTRAKRRLQIFRFLGFNTWLWITVFRWQCKNRKLNQSSMFPMLDGVDVAIRQETLENSINDVFLRLGAFRISELPRRNVTQDKKPYSKYYVASTCWLLDRVYGKEIKEMGYTFAVAVYDPDPVPLTPKGRVLLA